MKFVFLKNKIVLLLFLGLLSSFHAKTQISSLNLTRGSEAFSVTYFSTERKTTVQWLNPYLDENWQEGFIVFSDSVLWEGKLRYDLFRKEMEMVFKTDTVFISDPFMVNLIKMGNKRFVYSFFIASESTQAIGSDYFELLSTEGNAQFLVRRVLRVDESKGAPGNLLLGVEVETKRQFAQVLTYYFREKDTVQAQAMKRNKKSVLKAMETHQDEIKSFVKANKLGYRKPKNIAAIVNYFNSISSK